MSVANENLNLWLETHLPAPKWTLRRQKFDTRPADRPKTCTINFQSTEGAVKHVLPVLKTSRTFPDTNIQLLLSVREPAVTFDCQFETSIIETMWL